MNRISHSVMSVKEHVKEKFECTDCCTILCWSMVWVAVYTAITVTMIVLATCQILLQSELYELFPRRATVPYFMVGMILLQLFGILIYGVAISEQSDKIMLVGMVYFAALSVIFIIVAILTQIPNVMVEEESLNDEVLLDTMKYHFHNMRFMSFWVNFQKHYECCGVNNFKDWGKQTKSMAVSGGCCRPYSSSMTVGMAACRRYGMYYGIVKGCSEKIQEVGPFQVTRVCLLIIAILLAIYHIPGVVTAFILKRRFYVLYYLNYEGDENDADGDFDY